MEESVGTTKADEHSRLRQILDLIWKEIVLGDYKLNPEKSCFDLAKNYQDSRKTPDECARNFINWQTGKTGVSGFALGLPGFTFMPATIPLDFLSVSYLQLRMVAVIGLLFDWEVNSDQLKTLAFSCLLGTAAGEAVRDIGVKSSTRFGNRLVRGISGKALQKLNTDVLRVPRLFIKGVSKSASRVSTNAGAKAGVAAGAKVGTKGIVNLSKMVPLLGGVVGGGINIFVTRQMGLRAINLLKYGPPQANSTTGPIIDGEAEVI